MSKPLECESVNSVNHEVETTKQDLQKDPMSNGESQVNKEPPQVNKPDHPLTDLGRPTSNHVGYADVEPVQAEYSPRVHHQGRSSRSHLTSGDKVIQSRNRRRSFAGESSMERETTGYREQVGSTSKIYDDAARYGTNSYDGSKIPSYERRTGSMGRRESYGERRRYRDQNYNEDSPALRRNVSYGSEMENYGMYDHKGFDRVSRRDFPDGTRSRHMPPGGQDPGGVMREVYQELARKYERSQSATRLGYTEGGGYDNIYPQRSGYGRPGYAEAAPSGVREAAPPYYPAPRPAVRFDMPGRFPGPNPHYPGEYT